MALFEHQKNNSQAQVLYKGTAEKFQNIMTAAGDNNDPINWYPRTIDLAIHMATAGQNVLAQRE